MCYQQHTANIPITKNITFQCAPIFNFKCLIYIKDFCVALNDCPSVAKVLFKYRCWTELALYFEQYIFAVQHRYRSNNHPMCICRYVG